MNKEDFIYIGCKLLALFWAMKAIYAFGSFLTAFAAFSTDMTQLTPQMEGLVYFNLVPLVLYVIAASILWFGANKFVKIILPTQSERTENNSITLHQIQSVAFATVGLLVFVSSLPEIGGVLYKIHLMREMDNQAQISFEAKSAIFSSSLKIILGILLFFGAKGLSGLLMQIRGLGMK